MKSLRILATWELLQCSYAAGLVSDHGSGSKTEKEKILNFFLHAPPQLAGAPFSDHLAKKKVSPQVFVAFQFYNQCCPESKEGEINLGNSPPVWVTSLTLLPAYLQLVTFQNPQAGAFYILFTVFHYNQRARLLQAYPALAGTRGLLFLDF